MPLPSLERDRAFGMRWKRSNRRGISAGGHPDPGVGHPQHGLVAVRGRSVTLMVPSKVNFSALLSRLSTTFSHISRST